MAISLYPCIVSSTKRLACVIKTTIHPQSFLIGLGKRDWVKGNSGLQQGEDYDYGELALFKMGNEAIIRFDREMTKDNQLSGGSRLDALYDRLAGSSLQSAGAGAQAVMAELQRLAAECQDLYTIEEHTRLKDQINQAIEAGNYHVIAKYVNQIKKLTTILQSGAAIRSALANDSIPSMDVQDFGPHVIDQDTRAAGKGRPPCLLYALTEGSGPDKHLATIILALVDPKIAADFKRFSSGDEEDEVETMPPEEPMVDIELTIRARTALPLEQQLAAQRGTDIVTVVSVAADKDWPYVLLRLRGLIERHVQQTAGPLFCTFQSPKSITAPAYEEIVKAAAGRLVKILALADIAEPPPPAPHPPEEIMTVFPEQKLIAERLFRCTETCLQDLHQFTALRVLVYVPVFTTLQHQTMERMIEAGLMGEGPDDVVDVLMYDSKSAEPKRIYQEFKKSADENKHTLHLIIADECHWGPVKYQSHDELLNDRDLLLCANVFRLLVSATPYNCLTMYSRIKPDRVIYWSNEIREHGRIIGQTNYRSRYRGLDDTIKSVAFTLDDTDRLFFFYNRQTQEVRMRELPLGHLYSTLEDLADAITNHLQRDFGLECKVERPNRGAKRFRINMIDQQWMLKLSPGPKSLLQSMGFTEEDISQGGDVIIARGQLKVDANQSLRSQRIRRDKAFHELRIRYERKFNIKHSKENGEEGGAATKESKKRQPTNALNRKAAHIMLVDYMMALAYFAMFRVGSTWKDEKDDYTFLEEIGPDYDASMRYNEANVTHYIDKVLELATFPTAGPNGKTVQVDLRSVVHWLLHLRAEFASVERDEEDVPPLDGDLVDYGFLVPNYLYIFQQLRKAELEDHYTTAEISWYTETERAVHDLLSVDRAKGWGPMVVVRVYDNDECLSFQTGLRHAMKELGLVADTLDEKQPFSVLNDIGSTVIYQHIEKYFLNFPLRDKEPQTLHALVRERSEAKGKHMTALKYEDLNNLPALLILCNKGRLGDTFPSSFRSFDLRLRTSEYLASLVQELGRLCRYPSTTPLDMVVTKGSLSSEQEDQLTPIFNQHRSILIKSSSGSIIDHADSLLQLTLQLRSCGKEEVVLEAYDYPLPCAIVKSQDATNISTAIGLHRELPEKDKETTSLVDCLKRKADMYIRPAATCTLYKQGQSVQQGLRSLKVSNKHYDHGRASGQYDLCRILLYAECQIGKTGAYIHYIQLLLSRVKEEVPNPIIEVTPACSRLSQLQWRFPYWKDIMAQSNIDYTYPRYGKYHEFVLSQRLALLVKCVQHPSERGWLGDYCATIRGSNGLGELVLSSKGRDRLRQLQEAYGQQPAPLQVVAGSITVDNDRRQLFEHVLDWDDRLDHGYNAVRGQYLSRCLDESLRRVQSELSTMGFQALGSTTSVQWRSWDACNLDDVRPATAAACEGGRVYEARPLQLLAKVPAAGQYAECGSDLPQMLGPRDEQHGIHLWRFEREDQPRWSIPDDKLGLFDIVGRRVVRANIGSEASKKLKVRWIFTITYNRAVPGRRAASLDRSEAMDLGRDEYVEVLVVRPGDQFKAYQLYHGRTHVIMAMPAGMEMSYSNSAEGGQPSPLAEYKADLHGCGYARAVAQIVARCLGLNDIWMIDDNVGRCWEIDRERNKAISCSFSQAMRGLEAIVGYESDFFQLLTTNQLVSMPDEVEHLRPKQPPVNGNGPVVSLEDFSGKRKQYGIIGMSRDVGKKEVITRPFQVTYSVYSFFLLNVSATIDKRLLFPARTWWEDIEFNNMLDEAGLVVVKSNRFAHWKRAIGRADVNVATQAELSKPNDPVPDDPVISLKGVVWEECCAIVRLGDYFFVGAHPDERQWADSIEQEWGELQPESSTALGLLERSSSPMLLVASLPALLCKASIASAEVLMCVCRKEDEEALGFQASVEANGGSIEAETALFVVAKIPVPQPQQRGGGGEEGALVRSSSVITPPLEEPAPKSRKSR